MFVSNKFNVLNEFSVFKYTFVLVVEFWPLNSFDSNSPSSPPVNGLQDWLRKRTVTHNPRFRRPPFYVTIAPRSTNTGLGSAYTHTPPRRFGPARALRAAADSRPAHVRRDGQSVVTVHNARVGCAALHRLPATHARHTRARFRLLDAVPDRNAGFFDFGCSRLAVKGPWIARSGPETTDVRPRLMRLSFETVLSTRYQIHDSSRTRHERLPRDGKSKTI